MKGEGRRMGNKIKYGSNNVKMETIKMDKKVCVIKIKF